MGNPKNWLKARARNKQLIERTKRIAAGGLIAAVIVGPLLYFGVVAVPIELRNAQTTQKEIVTDLPTTPEIALETSESPEIKISKKPIEFPDIKEEKEIKDPIVEFKLEDLPEVKQRKEDVAIAYSEIDANLIATLKSEFRDEDKNVEIKTTKKLIEGQEETLVVMQNIDIDDGPRKVQKNEDANTVARAALRRYLKTNPQEADFDIYKDTSKLKNSKKTYQLVISDIKTNNEKWYVTFQQYKEALPVFDGNVKMIFTERKELKAITDNIRTELPDIAEFQITNLTATESAKEVFEWDEQEDRVDFVNKGYYKNKPAFKVELESFNPLGNYEVFVDGATGDVENITGDIRLANETEEPVPPVELNPTSFSEEQEAQKASDEAEILEMERQHAIDVLQDPNSIISNNAEEIFQAIIAPVNEVQPIFETSENTFIPFEIIEELIATPDVAATPDIAATQEPAIVVLNTLFSQVLGSILPKTPDQAPVIQPFKDQYVYYNSQQFITDEQGYFENKNMNWYSVFLDGPYVTVHDDDATSNTDIKDRTPEDPFVWDEENANIEAINAFYHTNKLHDYFKNNHNYDLNKNIPLTVNSELVDQYIGGCGAWFNNADKTIEMGRGGTFACPDDLNYALSSDMIYHEYTHFVVEEITHLPNIAGSEAAAMGEGLADYFAASINDDSVWGDVVAPNNTRDLKNTLDYNINMTGESHHDGQIFSGALWDLRILIGAEATDKLVFNTLYQDRLHFETFMYGMLIEDDDNNDFSDGTPHMLEIIAAFQNHGIGPGIGNFDGLPVDPALWTELLGEEAPVGEENPIMNAFSGTCTIADSGGYVTLYGGGTCYWTGIGTRTRLTVFGGTTLYIGSSSTYGSLTITEDVYVYNTGYSQSRVYLGAWAAYYGRLTWTRNMKVYNGGYVAVQGANANSYLRGSGVAATLAVYNTSAAYTQLTEVQIRNTNINNNLQQVFVGRDGADNINNRYGEQARVYVYTGANVELYSLNADNGGSLNSYGTVDITNGVELRNRARLFNWGPSGNMNLDSALSIYDNGYVYTEDVFNTNSLMSFYGTSYMWLKTGAAFHPSNMSFNVDSHFEHDGGTINITNTPTLTFNDNAYMNNDVGSVYATTINLNNDSRWNHYGGATSIGDFNIYHTADVRVNTSGQTLTATNFTLNDSGILGKEYYSVASNGDGNISATNITLNDTSQLRAFRSTGNITVGTLTINSNSVVTNGAVYQTNGTINATTLAELSTDASLYNIDGGTSTFTKLKMGLDSEFQNDGTVNLGTGGAIIGCVIASCDGPFSWAGDSLFTNNYTAGGTASVTITSGNTAFFMNNASNFVNNTGGTLTATSSLTFLDVGDSSQFDNYGIVNVYNMRVGFEVPTETIYEQGGFYYNHHDPTQGLTNISNDLFIDEGYFDNATSSLPTYGVDVGGNVDIQGELGSPSSNYGTITNNGEMDISGSITMHEESGVLSNQTSSSTDTAAEALMNVGVDINVSGIDMTINNKADLNIGDDFIMTALSSSITNLNDVTDTGVINVDDEFDIFGTTGTYAAPYLDNYGDINVTGSASTHLKIAQDSDINNYVDATITVDIADPTSLEGIFYIYDNATLQNQGTVEANHLFVGDGSTPGGTLSNINSGTIHVTYNQTSYVDYAMHCYRADCSHSAEDLGDANLKIDGLLSIEGVSGDPTIFYMSRDATLAGVKIMEYGELDISNVSQIVTVYSGGDSFILDDQDPTTPSNDGLLDINDGNKFDSTEANIILGYDAGGSYSTGGNIDNNGIIYSEDITMYASSEILNQDNRTINVFGTLDMSNLDEEFERHFHNYGTSNISTIKVYGDDAMFNNQAGTSSLTDAGNLDIVGGEFRVESGANADISNATYVYHDSGSITNGELYNLNTFSTGLLHVGDISAVIDGGYVQNGSQTTAATFTIGTLGAELYSGGPIDYGIIFNQKGTFTIGDAVDGPLLMKGMKTAPAQFINGDTVTDLDAIVIADFIWMFEWSDFENYGDIDWTEDWRTDTTNFSKNIWNYEIGDMDGVNMTFSNGTLLDNYHNGQIDLTDTLSILTNTTPHTTTYINNYSHIQANKLTNGSFALGYGGIIDNEANGDFTITSTLDDAAEIWDGVINQRSNADALTINGRLTIGGAYDTIYFDGQTVDFTIGEVISGATSGTSGILVGQTDNGADGLLTLENVDGTFQDNEQLLGPLNYDSQFSGDFTVGDKVTGNYSTNGYAEILRDEDNGLTGKLALQPLLGSFQDNEILNGPLDYVSNSTDFSLGETVTGGTSGATGIVVWIDDATLEGELGLKQITGIFQDAETLSGSSGGWAVTAGTIQGRAYINGPTNIYNGTALANGTIATNHGEVHQEGLSALISLGELYIENYGYYEINGAYDDPGTLISSVLDTGTTSITGADGFDRSILRINGSQFEADSTVDVYAYGQIDNNQIRTSSAGGYVADGLTTVDTNGLITSDNTSTFNFTGLTAGGEVYIQDDAVITNDLIVNLEGLVNLGFQSVVTPNVGKVFIVRDLIMYGSSTELNNSSQLTVGRFGNFGDTGINPATFNNFGYTDSSLISAAGFNNDITIQKTGTINSDGPLYTNDNIIVDAGGTVNLEDDTSDTYCYTAVGLDGTGDLTINQSATDIGKVTVNCTRTSVANELAVTGTSNIYGELELNSGMQTTDMIVGESGSSYPTQGLVTHRLVADITGDNDPTIVFLLTIGNDLTVNTEGDINVNELSAIKPSGASMPYGGVFGGKGHYSTVAGIVEYGTIESGSQNYGRAGIDSPDRDLGYGGGKAQVLVYNDAIVNGSITANGQSVIPNLDVGGGKTYDSAGSGGSIFLTINGALSGSGDVTANGGSATPDTSGLTADAMAGGGGRIYLEYYDKSAYTGNVQAFGGTADRDSSVTTYNKYAGTGTIFYKWINPWANQNDGTLVIDANNNAADVNLDNIFDITDATTLANLTDKYLDVESVQLENKSKLHLPSGGLSPGGSEVQQCLEESGSTLYLDASLGRIYYNRDHGPTTRNVTDGKPLCIATPDPADTLYINNATGAQTAINAEEGDPIATLLTLIPKFSANHFDGRFDSNNSVADVGSEDPATHFQLEIYETDGAYPDTPQYMFNDNITYRVCNIDTQLLDNSTGDQVADGNRMADEQVDFATCGTNLNTDTTYYYRMRFREEDPANSPYWGLWSQANQFEIDEGGTITLNECGGVGNTQFNIGQYDSSTGDNFDEDYCTFDTDATTTMYIKLDKNNLLTHAVTPVAKIIDMLPYESDPTTGMDGIDDSGTETNEVGFYLDNVNTGEFDVGKFHIGASDYYTNAYSYLPNNPTNIIVLTSNGGYANETFDMWLGAFINGLIPHGADPIGNDPTGTCGTSVTDACTSLDGAYSAKTTFLMSPSP